MTRPSAIELVSYQSEQSDTTTPSLIEKRLQLPSLAASLIDSTSRDPTPNDTALATFTPVTTHKLAGDVASCGTSYCFRRSRRNRVTGHKWKGVGYAFCGMFVWNLVIHGLGLISVPVGLRIAKMQDEGKIEAKSGRSPEGVRVDMVARALIATRNALRLFCDAAVSLSQDGGAEEACTEADAEAWLMGLKRALEEVSWWIERSDSVKIKQSCVLQRQIKLTRKAVTDCEKYAEGWDNMQLAVRPKFKREWWWDRVDYVPKAGKWCNHM